jgi:pimeloyl-ACP methyl ester carboxylesterase
MGSYFVLVPGACHGGWWYEPLATQLEREGHRASPVTPVGLDPEQTEPPGVVTLDDHVAQVLALATAVNEEERLVLVGHSYGGSVISGVADQIASRVAALVYLDAFVPEHGDSCFSMTDDEQRRWYIEGAGRTGLTVEPLPFFDARARPHPLGTFIQRSRLTGAWRSVTVKHYVTATDWPGASPFASITARVSADPEWIVHEWATRHNVMHDGPARVLRLLLEVADAVA